MIEARFRMELPPDTWIAEVSTAFPGARFRLLTGVPVEDRTLELGEVVGDTAQAAGEAIRTHNDVVDYDRIYSDDQRTIAQYETGEQRLYAFLGDASLPPEFPIVVEDGWMEFDMTATRNQFEAFGTVLDTQELAYELLTVSNDRETEALLTDRQRECLSVALTEGYFQVPRACTLEDVADRLGVDKSTASETIRRGAATVLEGFLVGQASP